MKAAVFFVLLVICSTYARPQFGAKKGKGGNRGSDRGTASDSETADTHMPVIPQHLSGYNSYLAQAFDVAFSHILNDGIYASTVAELAASMGFMTPADGFSLINSFDYPEGLLHEVLERGYVIVGNALYFDGENQVYTDLLIKIFEYISAHYGTTIEIHQRVYETSPEAFFGLYKGEVDMIGPNFSIAANVFGAPRRVQFRPSLVLFNSNPLVYTSVNMPSITDYDSLLAASAGQMIATFGAGSVAQCAALFPDAMVVDWSDVSANERGAALDNGTLIALYEVSGVNITVVDGFNSFIVPVDSPACAFFRYDGNNRNGEARVNHANNKGAYTAVFLGLAAVVAGVAAVAFFVNKKKSGYQSL